MLFRSGSFLELTNQMLKDTNTIKTQIEDSLTQALSQLVQTKNNGIGFIPTMRNVLAVIFASGEAFLECWMMFIKKRGMYVLTRID